VVCSLSHSQRQHRAIACAALSLFAGLSLAGTAQGATLGLDQRCYVAGEKAAISGSGFAPRASVTLTRGTDPISATTADNSGAIKQTLMVPEVAFGLVESQVEVVANDGTSTARAFLNIANVGASYTPTTGDPKTLSVSHVVSGFGLAEVKPSIYLHYVSPTAQRTKAKSTTTTKNGVTTTSDPAGVKTIRLGQLRGPCGVLKTSPRRLFPFKAEKGQWLLQYDTRPGFTRGTSASSFLWSSRKITIAG
jgi:hypothetical protein